MGKDLEESGSDFMVGIPQIRGVVEESTKPVAGEVDKWSRLSLPAKQRVGKIA